MLSIFCNCDKLCSSVPQWHYIPFIVSYPSQVKYSRLLILHFYDCSYLSWGRCRDPPPPPFHHPRCHLHPDQHHLHRSWHRFWEALLHLNWCRSRPILSCWLDNIGFLFGQSTAITIPYAKKHERNWNTSWGRDVLIHGLGHQTAHSEYDWYCLTKRRVVVSWNFELV